ncbi:MAG: transaldolase family protein, partial [Bacteroidales bacterium]
QQIHRELKGHGLDTVVMAASFRNTDQIEALAGCDRLTISPALLEELDGDQGRVDRRLDRVEPGATLATPVVDEADFRWALNQDPMAGDLLSDGIRRFARDQQALEELMSPETAHA